MVWTDSALYSMQFIGAPFTFGFKQIGSNCGAVGIHSAVDVSGTSFWMSDESFFMFDGSVKKIPCSVQDYVFDDINQNAKQDVFCAANSDFNEVMWFYPSDGSDQIDRVVMYNYAENLWYIGSLARSSWADSGVYPVPYATEFDSSDTTASISTINGLKAGRTFVYLHETGVNDDGSAMSNHIESGDIDIADGDQFMSIARFIPDFKNQAGTVDMTIKTRPYPSGTQTNHGSFDITTSTTKKDTRILPLTGGQLEGLMNMRGGLGEGFQYDFDVDGENRTYSFDEPLTEEGRQEFLTREGITQMTDMLEGAGATAANVSGMATGLAMQIARSMKPTGRLNSDDIKRVMQMLAEGSIAPLQLARMIKTAGRLNEDDIERAKEMLNTVRSELGDQAAKRKSNGI